MRARTTLCALHASIRTPQTLRSDKGAQRALANRVTQRKAGALLGCKTERQHETVLSIGVTDRVASLIDVRILRVHLNVPAKAPSNVRRGPAVRVARWRRTKIAVMGITRRCVEDQRLRQVSPGVEIQFGSRSVQIRLNAM